MGRNRTMRSNLNFNLADAFGVKDPSAAAAAAAAASSET